MTMYYTTDDGGAINSFADWNFAPDAIETDQNIVYGTDGKLYFAGEEPAPAPYSRIQAIQAHYAPLIADLQAAYTGALLYDDGEDAAEIQAEYQALVSEMEREIEDVQKEAHNNE